MPDFKTAQERTDWIISHSDYFTVVQRFNRKYLREEHPTLIEAEQAAYRIVAADPQARVMIYAVAGVSDTWVRTIDIKALKAKQEEVYAGSPDPQL